jgi:hypothetical protein
MPSTYSLTDEQRLVLNALNLTADQVDTLKRAGAIFVEAISLFHQTGQLSDRNAAYERAKFCFELSKEKEMVDGLAGFWKEL